jgi:hypothetical protein
MLNTPEMLGNYATPRNYTLGRSETLEELNKYQDSLDYYIRADITTQGGEQ